VNDQQHRTKDPGPPTWQEAIEGFRLLRTKAGERLQQAREQRRFLAPADTKADQESWGRISMLDAEWKHWNTNVAWAQSFLSVHPFMAKSLLTAKCPHGNACRGVGETSYYSEPGATAVPVEREPGEDDLDEVAF
jgi:hypothetical protein